MEPDRNAFYTTIEVMQAASAKGIKWRNMGRGILWAAERIAELEAENERLEQELAVRWITHPLSDTDCVDALKLCSDATNKLAIAREALSYYAEGCGAQEGVPGNCAREALEQMNES
jgi:hypothetical protein